MMKKTLVTFLFLLVTAVVHADEQAKIGYINATRVMNEIPQAEEIRKSIKKEFAPRDKKLIEMQAELKKKEEMVARTLDAGTETEAERSKLEREIFTLKRDIKRAREEFTEDLNIRRNEELSKLQKLVYEAIILFAKNREYDLILGDSVLFSSKKIDVTDKLIERLKNEYNSSMKIQKQ